MMKSERLNAVMKKVNPIIVIIIVIVALLLLTTYTKPSVDTDSGDLPTPASGAAGGENPTANQAPATPSTDETNQKADQNEGQSEPGDKGQETPDPQIEAELAAKRSLLLEQCELLFRGYFYDEAIGLLNADDRLINDETRRLEEEIKQTKSSLVLFEGEIKHIFFHSLILYPEYLFPNINVPTGGYNEGFSCQSELKKMLPQLLERGYVLYNINDVFAKDNEGNMKQKDVYLPPGKRPLVLSIDDPTYHYGIGFANRMLLDESGELATEVITPAKEKIVTYDGDVELVVDSFVEEHPEFSYRGHKGIIAATGYMGIFGYDLETGDSCREAKAVCDKMKDNGWLFASHSYTHNGAGYWGTGTVVANIEYDVSRWRARMEPVIGNTNIFIAPFGWILRGEAMEVILANDFDIYCNVDFNNEIKIFPRYALMGRIEIGGYTLSRVTGILNRDFFDVNSVKDPRRPPVLSS